MQLFGGSSGSCGLGGMTLCSPKIGNGLGERGKANDERRVGEAALVRGKRGGGQQSCGTSQIAPGSR